MKVSDRFQCWLEARKRHRLSHVHIQMALELGMNPKKLGKLDNHKQEPWKAPLPEFIEHCYFKRFGQERPTRLLTIEDMVKVELQKKKNKLKKKLERRVKAATARDNVSVSTATCNDGTEDCPEETPENVV